MTIADISHDGPGQPVTAPPADIDVLQLLQRLWRRKLLLLLFLVIGIGGAVLYLGNVTYRYTAELTVTPADQNNAKVPSSVSSLGSLVGVDLGSQSGSSFALFADTVRSYPVAEVLAGNPKLMRRVFHTQWDDRAKMWREPRSPLSALSGAVKSFIGVPDRPWRQPSAVELRDYVREFIIVTEDKKKSMLTFSYSHQDPAFASELLQSLVDASDNFLRQKSLERSTIYVGYLERRINEVQVAEYRNLLSQALVSYENKRMMASSKASFAADQFGDVWVSSKPTSPVPIVVIAIGISAAFLLWIFYVLIFESIRDTLRMRRGITSHPAAS